MNIKLILNAIVTTKCLLQKLGETGIFMVGGELKILPVFFFFFQLSQEFVFLQQPLITSQIKISIWQEKKKLKCFMDLVILLEQ